MHAITQYNLLETYLLNFNYLKKNQIKISHSHLNELEYIKNLHKNIISSGIQFDDKSYDNVYKQNQQCDNEKSP